MIFFFIFVFEAKVLNLYVCLWVGGLEMVHFREHVVAFVLYIKQLGILIKNAFTLKKIILHV